MAESMQGSIQEYSKLEFAVKLSAMADGSQGIPWDIPDILIKKGCLCVQLFYFLEGWHKGNNPYWHPWLKVN